MAHQATTTNPSNVERYTEIAKKWLFRAAIAAVFFLIGLYIIAPRQQANQPTYLPQAYLALPTGAVLASSPDGVNALLPVRIADTSQARNQSFSGVGETAMDQQFLFYALSRPTANRVTYSTTDFRAPTDFAAISEEGIVTAIHRSSPSSERIAVPEAHRWLLVAKAGALERFGITEGATIDPESIRKF